jgi:hypothetical protein
MFQKAYLLAVLLFPSGTATAQTKEPLRVVGTFPKGQIEATTQAQTIIATFNKPMVPLQELPEGDGTGPLQIFPSIKGKYRWLGVNTLSFTPNKPLDIATEYKVRIPSSVKASGRSRLNVHCCLHRFRGTIKSGLT